MFINTLALIIAQGNLIGLVELCIVAVCLYAVLYISAPFPEQEATETALSTDGAYQYLLSGWLGEFQLWRIFWPFFVVLNGALYGADYWVWNGGISVSSWWNIHFILAAPVLWWAVGIWRSSPKSSSRLWIAMSRLAVFGALAEFGMRLYIYFKLPRQFFNCEELMLDYFSCF